MPFNPRDYGAVGDGTTNDTSAFAACKTAMATAGVSRMDLTKGSYLVEGFDVSNLNIVGTSRSDVTITGSGDLLINAQQFRLERITIRNSGTRGNLVSLTGSPSAAYQQSLFLNVEFGQASKHVYCECIAVDWSFDDCRFNDASIASRDFDYVTAYRESGCYTWYNNVGVIIRRGSNIKLDGVFEYNSSYGVTFVVADTSVGLYDVVMSAYFEGNGAVTLAGDVNIETSGAARIRNIKFDSATFSNSVSATNVRAVQGGGGNIQRMTFDNVKTDATLIADGAVPTPGFRQCEMFVEVYPHDALILDTAVTAGGGTINGSLILHGGVFGAVGGQRAIQQGGSGPITFDADTLSDGIHIITASIQGGGPLVNEVYSAVWLFQKRSGSTNSSRVIIASDAPGNNDGSIYMTGNHVTCDWGGFRNALINTTQLVA